jgi:hypothetical protein
VQQVGDPRLLVIRALGGEGKLNFLFVAPLKTSGLGVAVIAPLRLHIFTIRLLVSAAYAFAFDVGDFGALAKDFFYSTIDEKGVVVVAESLLD